MLKGMQMIMLYRMIEVSVQFEIHGAKTCIEIGTTEHGSNIRIEIDRPANRTRAEGCLYV